ncbi:MAG: hypothetical protein DMG89_16120, partial [Acidobacteria bacterium]
MVEIAWGTELSTNSPGCSIPLDVGLKKGTSMKDGIPMKHLVNELRNSSNRRSFMKNGLATVGTTTMGAALLTNSPLAFAERGPEEHSGRLTKGDATLLRFAAAAEILETDFWVQYNELGGVQDSEVPGGSGNPDYTEALAVLDEHMAIYIHDNTDDEFTHQNFLNAYLAS